jgi:hypothetical protein
MGFAGVAVVTGAAAFLASLFAFGSPAIVGLAPAALGVSLSLFLDRRTRTVVLPLFLLGIAAGTLAVVSWSTGFDEANAGVTRSLLNNLFVPASITAILLIGSSVGIAVASRLLRPPAARVLMGIAIGLLSVPVMVPLLVSPTASTVAAAALMIVLGLRARTALVGAKPRAPAARGVRPLAIVAFAMTLLSFGYGLIAGIAFVGTDAATQAMGIMAAGGNMASVPLMAALTQRAAPGRTGPRIGLVISGVGVAFASVAWAVGTDLSSGLFLAIPAFVAFWASTMAGALLPYRGLLLVGLSMVVAIGVAVAYFMFALTTAGGALAIASGILAFGGRRPRKSTDIAAEPA